MNMADYIREYWVPLSVAGVALAATAGFLSYAKLRVPSKYAHSSTKQITVSHIIVYPIKGCRGIERYSSELKATGLQYDREFALILLNEKTDTGRHYLVSQVRYPKVATLVPKLVSNDCLEVRDPFGKVFTIKRKAALPSDRVYITDMFGDVVPLVDQGDEAAKWFSDFLGVEVRLGRVQPGETRVYRKTGGLVENNLHYLTSILLLSDDSVYALSRDSGMEVSLDRFRPNIVISGCGEYAEDGCVSVDSLDGEIRFEGLVLCERCTYPGVDQVTGVLDPKVVAKFRSLRNIKVIREKGLYNPKFMKEKWTEQAYMMGLYVTPKLLGSSSSRIYVGQLLDMKF